MNEASGKKQDIAYKIWEDDIELWAENGLKNIIESVEGVNNVRQSNYRYNVYVDKRYDTKIVLENILYAIGIYNGS